MNINELKTTIENNNVQDLIVKGLRSFYKNDAYEYDTLINMYSAEEFNELHNDVNYFRESIQDIKQNWDHYENVYKMLKDDISKKTYLGMLYAKVFMDPHFIEDVYSECTPYFAEEIWGKFGNEVYLDCGAYTGGTVLKFINSCPWYKQIWAFEAIPEIANKCREQLSTLMVQNQVQVLPYAVSDANEKLYFSTETKSGDSHISADGNVMVDAVTLDSIVATPISFIKMDIEGSEKQAIIGAKHIIQKYTPKMAICIYHLKDDFWKIPELIRSINKNYEFAVRQHDCEVYAETVLYCIPKTISIDAMNMDAELIFKRVQLANSKLVTLDGDEYTNYINHVKAKKWFLDQIRGYKQQQVKMQRDIEELKRWIEELEKGKNWLEQHSEEQEKYIQQLLRK